ncbi:MAG: acyl-CoA thioesterase [Muribaculaceae bacterium]|nr:acyl-CoA thioesterase [Muribaculaceae bacterium]
MEELNLDQFRHRASVPLRFCDFDMLGHINNAVYLQLMDVAKAKYFSDITGKTPDPKGACPVVANINLNFECPTLPGESLDILTRTSHIGTKSITIEQVAVNQKTQQVKCRATVIMVNLDLTTGSTIEITQADREAISSFEGSSL